MVSFDTMGGIKRVPGLLLQQPASGAAWTNWDKWHSKQALRRAEARLRKLPAVKKYFPQLWRQGSETISRAIYYAPLSLTMGMLKKLLNSHCCFSNHVPDPMVRSRPMPPAKSGDTVILCEGLALKEGGQRGACSTFWRARSCCGLSTRKPLDRYPVEGQHEAADVPMAKVHNINPRLFAKRRHTLPHIFISRRKCSIA